MRVGFIGLGKLGMPCAEAMANKHEVVGFDLDKRESKKVMIKSNLREVVEGQDLVFIAVPTPHSREYDGSLPISDLPTKDFDYSMAKNVLSEISHYAKKDQILVLISTCLPGTVRNQLAPFVGAANLVYNPYFIAMGTVADDFLNPEFLTIGTSDGSIDKIKPLLSFYEGIVKDFKYKVGTWEEAEAIKIFYNTFISFKVGFVNMIQDVAQKLGNINVDVVTDALSSATYRLISPMYMKAGMGDGGPCHPRDNIALKDLADRLDLGYDLFGSIMHAREVQAKNLAMELAKYNAPVVILGKSFKPGVDLTDGSYSLLVEFYLKELGAVVYFHDPLTRDIEPPHLNKITYLIGHNHDWAFQHPFKAGSVIVDPWRKVGLVKGCEIVHYGNSRSTKNQIPKSLYAEVAGTI
jgi:UDPglucose 6-dehydrogenase